MPKHIREEGEIADTEDSSSSPTDTQQIATLVSRTRRSREGILSRQTAKKSCVQHVVRQKSKKVSVAHCGFRLLFIVSLALPQSFILCTAHCIWVQKKS